MASLLSSRRPGRSSARQTPEVRLTATRAEEADADPEPYGPRWGWQLLAVGGALVSAIAGWVIVAGLAVVGWLAADPGDLNSVLHTGTRLWLLANGAPARLGGVSWSLVPLGMSLVIAFMISRFTRSAVRFAQAEDPELVRVAAGAAGLATVAYTAVVAAVGLSSGADVTRGIIGAAVIAAIGSSWGATRGAGIRVSDFWPRWSRPLPAAVTAGVLVLALSGAVVLATGIVQHAHRISVLADGLGAGTVGGIALWAAQAAFAPNVVIWSASYALGAGFTIGQGSVVAPSDTSLGLLPSIPILGALPGAGPGATVDLAWLASGVVAGAAAAVFVVRGRPEARPDETSLVGGLAGLLAALVFTGLAWFTGGDLGDGRLTNAGPRMLPLLVMSCTLLGLSGMVCGLVFGLAATLRRVRSRRTADADQPADEPAQATEDDDTVAVVVEEVAEEAEDRTAPVVASEADSEDTVVRERRSA